MTVAPTNPTKQTKVLNFFVDAGHTRVLENIASNRHRIVYEQHYVQMAYKYELV